MPNFVPVGYVKPKKGEICFFGITCADARTGAVWTDWTVTMKQGNAWYANDWYLEADAPLGTHVVTVEPVVEVQGPPPPPATPKEAKNWGRALFVVLPKPEALNGGGATTVSRQSGEALDHLSHLYQVVSVSRLSHYIKDEPCTPAGVNKNFCVCDGPWIDDEKRTDVSKLKNMNR